MEEIDSFRTPWAFEQKLRKGKQGPRLWRPPTNARQWPDGDPKILITAVPLGEWGKITGGWVHPGWGLWAGLRLEQERSVWLGFHSLPARVWAGTQLDCEHACRCLWNGHQSHELAPCLAAPVARSPLSPQRRGHMNVSLITFPCNLDINPSWRNAVLAHTVHWKQPQAFLLSQVSGTVPGKSLFTYAIHRFYLVQCTVLQQPSNLHVLPDYLVIKPSKYKHTVIIV